MTTEKDNVLIDEESVDEAEKIVSDGVGTYVHKFDPPFEYQGKKYSELVFERDRFKGEDDMAILREMRAFGIPTFMAEYEPEYLYRLAARTCTEKIGYDAFNIMDGADSVKIRRKILGFLSKKA